MASGYSLCDFSVDVADPQAVAFLRRAARKDGGVLHCLRSRLHWTPRIQTEEVHVTWWVKHCVLCCNSKIINDEVLRCSRRTVTMTTLIITIPYNNSTTWCVLLHPLHHIYYTMASYLKKFFIRLQLHLKLWSIQTSYFLFSQTLATPSVNVKPTRPYF